MLVLLCVTAVLLSITHTEYFLCAFRSRGRAYYSVWMFWMKLFLKRWIIVRQLILLSVENICCSDLLVLGQRLELEKFMNSYKKRKKKKRGLTFSFPLSKSCPFANLFAFMSSVPLDQLMLMFVCPLSFDVFCAPCPWCLLCPLSLMPAVPLDLDACCAYWPWSLLCLLDLMLSLILGLL